MIIEAIVVRVSGQWFDRTGSDDPEYVAGLREAGIASVDYALAGIEHWGELPEPVPAEVVEQARRAARAGVGLETVLRRYFVGHTVLEDFIMQEAERGVLVGGALREAIHIISALVDRLTTAASNAYNKQHHQHQHTAGATGNQTPTAVSGQAPAAPHPADAATDGGEEERDVRRKNGAVTLLSADGQGSAARVGSRRERVLAAIVEVVAERGMAGASLGLVVERAGVSRPTFYKLFPGGLEDGLVAVMNDATERVSLLVARALESEQCWRDGLRAAVAAGLVFWDAQPALARVCLVDTLGASGVVVERREQFLDGFRALVTARISGEVSYVSSLAPEGVFASVLSVLRARLMAHPPRPPLIELLGPLMGLMVEHVEGCQAALEEEQRCEQLVQAIKAGEVAWALSPTPPTTAAAAAGTDPRIPQNFRNPAAQRLRQCVLYLAEHPGASNSDIARAIGLPHSKSRISRLLTRLQDQGIATKRSTGPGAPNASQLTQYGRELAQALAEHEQRNRPSPSIAQTPTRREREPSYRWNTAFQ
jgi:AcrR family transcriptional regulator